MGQTEREEFAHCQVKKSHRNPETKALSGLPAQEPVQRRRARPATTQKPVLHLEAMAHSSNSLVN